MCKVWAACATMSVLCGCGVGSEPSKPYVPQDYVGEVDVSLPPASQAKQEAVKLVFDELQRGTGIGTLPDVISDVRLNETFETFFGDTIALARWNFDGKPQGDDVPVVLHLREDKPDSPEREVKRVYVVSATGGRYLITRKH